MAHSGLKLKKKIKLISSRGGERGLRLSKGEGDLIKSDMSRNDDAVRGEIKPRKPL
jgi:hypothetical protein